MEFLSGYAAARAPLSAYQVEPHPPSQRSNRPTRSNSTSGAPAKRRPRVSGHIRTSSASTTSSSRTEVPSSPWLHQGAASIPASDQNLTNTAEPIDPDSPPTASTVTSASVASSADHRTLRRDQQQQQHHQRERMPASGRYYTNKQLPATPRLDTNEANSSKYLTAGSASEPSSGRTPTSANASTPVSSTTAPGALSSTAAAAAAFHDRRVLQHAAMVPDPGASSRVAGNVGSRAESVSSTSGATTVSSRTMLSSEPPTSTEINPRQLKPFVVRNGRTYISDPTLPYPLPVDLEELHRQTLRTLLLIQLFGAPVCSPALATKPPMRILEVGCGSGFWSMMCYKYYERQGLHAGMSFVGIDIAPIAPGASGSDGGRPDKDMDWRFVQHDLRKLPWPFKDNEFDLVMVKDMSMATTTAMQQGQMDEYLRILAPGGNIEIWESDHTLRMLRPHVPESLAPPGAADDEDSDDSDSDDEQAEAANIGAYLMTANTPLSAPLNNFLVEYNGWLSRALEKNSLSPVPCTLIGPLLVQEAEVLTGVESRRLVVPLSEVRWEREGVGGVVTKDGKSYIETKGRRVGKEGISAGKALEPGAAALRRTALLTVVQMIQSLEHILREVSGKSQDEWDGWLGKMMNDLVRENGTSWGECLEVGAWWARKRVPA
ncbi:hypothetical protein B0T17DRAFT_481164 [Bombardia bombarda]|uniref:Methyltransferase domain-containing protein n=1 Tax=Bombardia bombarda TaxID=252184 RepID=A0AA40CFI0_9PEZI|nr:hypothetical protein B0T17DRAFT_481164 [Bombardia bombarda]